MQNFRALGAFPPNPQPPAAGGFAPRPPKQPPPQLRISGYEPGTSSWSTWTDKTDFNKADFEQYLFNENAIIRLR